ncbi:Nramp family divalent metal transporter [Thermostilla marina]
MGSTSQDDGYRSTRSELLVERRSSGREEDPPRDVWGIARRLGPGMIIAAAVVGSGELIATTRTGAEAGFTLLWLILIGCVIKVFVQVELGRYAVVAGQPTLAALNELPGPRLRVNWVLWYWLVMFIVSLAQLGGIAHGVGQALAMAVPIDGSFVQLMKDQDAWDAEKARIEKSLTEAGFSGGEFASEVQRKMGRPRPDYGQPGYGMTDDVVWACLLCLITIVLLVVGRYALIQHVCTALVVAFTVVTVFCVAAIQLQPEWAVGWHEIASGLAFRLPPAVGKLNPLATALATFGIIGMGTNELITYPYWCLEKGYAGYTGPRDESREWAERARGWMRIMRIDAFGSMVIYTFATLAFYLLGAAVLHREGLVPAGAEMIEMLAEMYVPLFGAWTKWFFLFGAVAVLYSTFFSANAGHTRVAADAVEVFRGKPMGDRARAAWVRAYAIILPLFAMATLLLIRRPVQLILASGVMQAIMLPMLAGAALYFRYRRCDPRLRPSVVWDACLWLSSAGLLVAGVAGAYFTLFK